MTKLTTLLLSVICLLTLATCSDDGPTNGGGGGIGGTFELAFGGDDREDALALVPSGDGGVVLVGQLGRTGLGSKAHIQKVDGSGTVIWELALGSNGDYRFFDVVRATNGDYVAIGGGRPSGPLNFNFYAARVSANGSLLWEKSLGDGQYDEGTALAATSDGGFLLIGSSADNFPDFDFKVIKIDGSGNELWTETYSVSTTDIPGDIVATRDGGFVIVGQSSPPLGGAEDVYALKIDADGNEVWSDLYGGGGPEAAKAVGLLSDDRIVVAGWTSSFGQGGHDGYVLILSATGTELNGFTVGGIEDDDFAGLTVDANDNIILTGDTGPSSGYEKNLYLVQMQPGGTVDWQRTYGGAVTDRGRDVVIVDDALFTCGTTGESRDCCSDFYLIKTDLLGRL